MLYAIEAAAERTQHRPSRLVLIDPAPVNSRISPTTSRREFCARQIERRGRDSCEPIWRRRASASAIPTPTASAPSS